MRKKKFHIDWDILQELIIIGILIGIIIYALHLGAYNVKHLILQCRGWSWRCVFNGFYYILVIDYTITSIRNQSKRFIQKKKNHEKVSLFWYIVIHFLYYVSVCFHTWLLIQLIYYMIWIK